MMPTSRAGFTRLLVQEIVGTLCMAPYGARSLALHRRLQTNPGASPRLRWAASAAACLPVCSHVGLLCAGWSASSALRSAMCLRVLPQHPSGLAGPNDPRLLPNLQYGPAPRNRLDLYTPPANPLHPGIPHPQAPNGSASSSRSASTALGSDAEQRNGRNGAEKGAPVVLFVHGGVWASGERWHYAPLATHLAHAGVVVGVLSYSLYPNARSDTMVLLHRLMLCPDVVPAADVIS